MKLSFKKNSDDIILSSVPSQMCSFIIYLCHHIQLVVNIVLILCSRDIITQLITVSERYPSNVSPVRKAPISQICLFGRRNAKLERSEVMASCSNFRESRNLSSFVKEELSCPVCLGEYKEPKSLPSCAHSFCKGCLEQILRANKNVNTDSREIVCPTCRKASKIPDGGVESLPTCTLIVRLLEVTPGRVEMLEIQRALERSKPVIEKMKQRLQEIESASHGLGEKRQTTEREIHKVSNHLVDIIRQQEQTFCVQVGDFYTTKERSLEQQRNNVRTLLSNASCCVQLAEDVLQKGDVTELIELNSVLVQQLDEISDMKFCQEADAASNYEEQLEFHQFKETINEFENRGFGFMKTRVCEKAKRTPPVLDYSKIGKVIQKFGRKGSKKGEFKGPGSVAANDLGQIAVADYFNNRIQVFGEGGRFQFQFGKKGSSEGQFRGPTGVAFAPDHKIVVLDSGNYRVQVFDRSGQFISKFGSRGCGRGEFGKAEALSVDTDGNVIVADSENNRVQVFFSDGRFAFQFGGTGTEGFDQPLAVVQHKGEYFISDKNNYCIKVFDVGGSYVRQFGREGSGSGEFHCPRGLAIDSQGESVLVCDSENSNVQAFKLDGSYITKFETKKAPVGITLTQSGNLAVSFYYGNCVQILSYS